MAINTWKQHLRKNDPLRNAEDEVSEQDSAAISGADTTGIAMDLDRALSLLSAQARSCVVLSYHEGMSHAEIAETMDMPVGTVKSHIRRGTERLQALLSGYATTPSGEVS